MMKQKLLNKKTVGGAILVLLALLIFASRTIYNYNLPVATATKPSNGTLSKEEKSSGLIDWARTENIYAEITGKVEEVLVREGDFVEAGQPLMRLGFDRDEAERKLLELEVSREKLAIELQNIKMKLEKVSRNVADLKSEDYTADEVSDDELTQLGNDIVRAEAAADDAAFLLELGEVSVRDVQKAQDDLQALYLKRDNLKKSLEDQRDKNRESAEEQEKSRASRLADYEAERKGYELELQAKELERVALDRQEETCLETLSDYDAGAEITAPVAGTVTSLAAEKGQSIMENNLIVSIGVDEGFVVECSVSLDNNFILPGDECELSNASHVFKGTVSKIEPDAHGKTVHIDVQSDEATAGESFDVVFKKESVVSYVLVPNGALNQDNDGYYLNQIKRRDGLMGREYYLERLDVLIGDADASNTAILQGVHFFEPIVLISDAAVSPGDVVLLKNVSDFFEE